MNSPPTKPVSAIAGIGSFSKINKTSRCHLMKNYKQKCKIISAFMTVFLCLPFSANAQNFSFSVDTHVGLMFGHTHEYVYRGDRQISRLEWDENAVPFANAALIFRFRNVFLNGTIRAAIPVTSGKMRNFDYLLPNSDALTHFSQHNAFLDRHNNFNVSVGYNHDIKNFSLSPSLGFVFSNRKWTASDGFLQYALSGTALQGNEPIRTVTGPVVIYELTKMYFSASLAFSYSFLDRFRISLNFQAFPYIWAHALDHHILRATEFFDHMPGGRGGSLGLTFIYHLTPSLDLVGGVVYEHFFKQKGNTGQRLIGIGRPRNFIRSPEHSGAYSSRLWSVFLGTKLRTIF